MRMRGVEKNISIERCQVSLSASLRCVESRVRRGEEKRRRGEAGSGCQVCLFFYPSAPACAGAAAAARPDNKSFPTAPSGNLVTPANDIWRC